MNYKWFVVTFTTGKTVFASCFNEEEAKILSMAIMIKQGYTREIKSIVETKNIHDRVNTDYVA